MLNNELEDDLFKDINNMEKVSEDQLLASIRSLAVISTATLYKVCAFSKECPSNTCEQEVDYIEDILKYVINSWICNEKIKKDIIGYS